ncbi:hypothetical protein K7H20_16360 [Salipiger manganoxidans]|uniref:hypothetical protein n=1 Tax=Salipiger marinus TaxID=555512 RepID=UPI001E55858F|nr:hypothetical protein [Salipiger manganoxidans]MCD1619633.1 hypothetical protein [Salipiger manganoxidans]
MPGFMCCRQCNKVRPFKPMDFADRCECGCRVGGLGMTHEAAVATEAGFKAWVQSFTEEAIKLGQDAEGTTLPSRNIPAS